MDLKILPLISILLAAPQMARAQIPGSDDTSRVVVLRNAIDGNWHLRLASARDTVNGRVLAIEGGTVRLVGAQVSLPGIERIERMQKHGGGALAGGLIGGLSLGLLGAGLSGLCEVDCDWEWAKGFTFGAGLGGITGALIGYTVAPPRRSWHPIWP